MQVFGFILRLPVYVIGGWFTLTFAFCAAAFWLVLVPVVWLLSTPFTFLGAAFSGGKFGAWTAGLSKSVSDWTKAMGRTATSFGEYIADGTKWLTTSPGNSRRVCPV